MKNLLLVSLLFVSCIEASSPKDDERAKDYMYGLAADKMRQAMEHLENGTVNIHASSGNLVKTSENLQKVFSADAGKEFGDALGAAVVTGAAGAVKSGMLTGVASAKATAIAVATAPATPLVAAGGVFAYLGYLGIGIEKNKTYGRCIRTHWDSPALNENGVPKRCDSPARRAAWWYPKIAERQNRYASILRAEGRRPRRLTDENYYSIGEISSHDLDGKDDK